jgi:hypothetical protein
MTRGYITFYFSICIVLLLINERVCFPFQKQVNQLMYTNTQVNTDYIRATKED